MKTYQQECIEARDQLRQDKQERTKDQLTIGFVVAVCIWMVVITIKVVG